MDFTVKARRAESETEPGRFVGTGPRTVDSDRGRAADGGVAPDWGGVPAVDVLEILGGADRPAVSLNEPGDELVDRSRPCVVRW